MTNSMSKDGIVKGLDEDYKTRRESLTGFLSTEQLAHLDKRHEEERKEAEATAGAIGGMFGAFMTSTPSKSESKDG